MLHVVRWSLSGLAHGAVIRQLAVLLTGTFLFGCSLKPADQGSRVSLVLPNPQSFALREFGSTGRIGLAPTTWNSTDFKCYGVNIVGSGIADSSKNPDPAKLDISALLAGTKSCTYKGITSPGFVFAAGSTDVVIDLQVPAGAARVIQLIGITNVDHCGQNFLTGAAAGSPGAYEIGRRVVDLFGDTTVSIPIDYAQTEDRRVDCGGIAATVVSVSLDSAGNANNYVNLANQAAVPVSGTCSVVGGTVDVKFGGTVLQSVTCAAGGIWSTALDLSNNVTYPEGSLNLSAEMTVDGVAATPATRLVTKDVTAPTSTTLQIAGGAAATNNSAPDLTISSIGANEMYVTNTAGCGAGGVWEAYSSLKTAWTHGVANATATVYLQVRDTAGNISPCVSDTIVHDSIAPTVAFTTPAAGSYITPGNVSTFSVTGSCSENTKNVVISGAVNTTVVCSTSAWSATLDFSAAGQGAVSITVNHVDAAGNAAAPETRSFIKDTFLPTVSISTPAPGSYVNFANQAAIAATGGCSENTRNVVISGDAAATVVCTGGAWSATLDFSAAIDGTVSILVDHTDAAGNVATSASRSFTKDTVLPTVAITSPSVGSYINIANQTALPISGACSDSGEIVTIDGGGVTASVSCSAGAWSTSLDLSTVVDGSVVFTIDHSDAAGNPAVQATRTISKDTVPPTATITNPTVNAEVGYPNLVSFSANGNCSEEGSSVMYSGTFTVSGGVTCTGGAWSLSTDLTSAADGAHSLSITHHDAAGNPATVPSVNFFKIGAPSQLAFSAVTPQAPASVHIDSCYGPLDIIAQDSFNRESVTSTALVLNLVGGGVFSFYPNAECRGTAIGIANIPVGNSRVPVYYRATVNSSATIQATDSGSVLTMASRSLSVLAPPVTATLGATASGAREEHSTVWTNTEMIVWGGVKSGTLTDTGERFTGGSVGVVGASGAPEARKYHSAVWTGSEMIVWGGINGTATNLNSGGRYASGVWTTMTTTGAPVARHGHSAVWTGSEMVVWGGYNGTTYMNTGGHYATVDSWTSTGTGGAVPSGRKNHAAVWTGAEMLIWGGSNGTGTLNSGARYDPASGTWTAMSAPPAGFVGRQHFAYAWSGTHLYIFGGMDSTPKPLSDGAVYNPSNNGWILLPKEGAPRFREYASGAWGNGKFVVAGGWSPNGPEYHRYSGGFEPGANPSTGTWSAVDIFTSTGPSGARSPSLIYTGSSYWIFGGGGNSSLSLFSLPHF